MQKTATLLFLVLGILFLNCSNDANTVETPIEEPVATKLYFPPNTNDTWETTALTDLEWNMAAEQPLYDFLEEKNTDAFIILKDGKIVLEKYFGEFKENDNHTWFSAGKTLTAMTIGIAQEEGFLDLTDTSSTHLGIGWSSLSNEQEQNITIWNHLTMTTGLDYEVANIFCYDPECLQYKNEPSKFWFYHNATYTLLDAIITEAVATNFEDYFYEKIRDKIGMQGLWITAGYNNIYFSNARSMARFGLLNLNNGVWNGETILSDTKFLNDMKSTSQDFNMAYGYLWWLNGKNTYRVPGLEEEFTGKLIPNAPDDLYAGLGKDDQKLYIIPSENMVIIRMGADAGEAQLGPSSFDNDLWVLLNDLMEK